MSPSLARADGRPMDLRERVLDPSRKDEISEVLLTLATDTCSGPAPAPYQMNYYPPGLRERALGPHSPKWIGVSRFYMTLVPKVVVDFEPQKPDPWYYEQKLQFFFEKGIIYFPIHLYERLTDEQFSDRYKQLKMALDRQGADAATEKALLDATLVESTLAEPEVLAAVDKLAILRAEADRDPMGRPYGGAVRLRKIEQHKRDIVASYRARLRHGRLDPGSCAEQLADEIARRTDGQVHPPVPG